MSKTAILSVRIISDAKNAIAGFNAAGGGLDKLEGKLKNASAAMSVASAAVIGIGKQTLDAASALQQSTGAVESVFKSQSDAIKNLAANAADSVGLSANQYQEFASVMGSQLKNLGIDQQALVPTTDKLISMGADLASMFGGTTAEAVEALSAVFRGETDPIERYGISIKESDVQARLAAEGLDGLEGEARRQAETQARLSILTEQSADAQGNFARETDTAAGSAQIAAAHWENAKAALGESLLPAATAAAEVFAQFAQSLSEHPGLVKVLAGSILGLTGALLTGLAAIKMWRIGSAIFSGISTAIGAMTGRIVFGNAIAAGSSATAASTSAAAWIGAAIRTVAGWAVAAARMIAQFAIVAARAAVHAGAAALAWIGAGLRAAGGWVVMAARAIGVFALTAGQAALHAGAAALAWVLSAARAAAGFTVQIAAMAAVRGATLLMVGAQKLLNLVMAANPIGLVVAAVMALVGALILAYQRSETFRNAVQTAGRIGKAAFDFIVDAIRGAIRAVGDVISKVGGVGGAFRRAMDIAAGAVRVLTAPIRGLIDLIGNVISAIGRIRFPSPPAWMGRILGADVASTPLAPAAPFTFMAPPPMTFAAAPEITAARTPSLTDIAPLARARGGGHVTIDNSVHIEVDGSGIVDPRRVAEQIRRALADDGRNRGLRPAAGGGLRWA